MHDPYPIFDGQVDIEQVYLILDDTLTMGGTFGGKNNLVLDSTRSPKGKPDILPKPQILTPSEIELLRQDLKDSVEYLMNKLKNLNH